MKRLQASCTIRSHGTKSHLLRLKLHSGTFKTKACQGGLVRVALFWKSHYATVRPSLCDFVPRDRRRKRIKCLQELVWIGYRGQRWGSRNRKLARRMGRGNETTRSKRNHRNKQNDRNKTTETRETTETKPPKPPKRPEQNHRNTRNDRNSK